MKKLTLALIAFMAVGASAQSRHYEGATGVIHTGPGVMNTRVVEVVTPVRVITPLQVEPVSPATKRVILMPSPTTVIIQRDVDTADVELLRNQDFDAYEDGRYDYHLDRARYDHNYMHRDMD